MECYNLCPVPTNEECQQAPYADPHKAHRECLAFKHQLERTFPTDCGATFIVKSFPYEDFSYKEVCLVYDDNDPVQTEYFYLVEGNLPINWDAEAVKELA